MGQFEEPRVTAGAPAYWLMIRKRHEPCQRERLSGQRTPIAACQGSAGRAQREGGAERPNPDRAPQGRTRRTGTAPGFPHQRSPTRTEVIPAPEGEGSEPSPVVLLLKSVRKFPLMVTKPGLQFALVTKKVSVRLLRRYPGRSGLCLAHLALRPLF